MKKKLCILLSVLALSITLTGCKAYDKPEVILISPSETAFLIPLVGDTSKQGAFNSEALLAKTKISTKEIEIPHRWLKTGRMSSNGEWRATATLIKVERKPVTREWTESSSGTSIKNEGIVAESKESIGFMSRMNCSAQIDEADAVKFLYRYNNKPLEGVMDTEIRAKIESTFVEECGKLSLDDILIKKEVIMNTIRNEVIPYFKEKGISVTVIGMKGEFTYLDKGIQESINKKFTTQKSLEAQTAENTRLVSKAKADAEAVQIQASTISSQIKLKELENQSAWIAKWDGKAPTVSGSSSVMYGMPNSK